ncbi:cell wall-active antibiotics response protein [Bacillus aquiflavi]|uniref:Cell wall-active antibiotics response protein n=1 Tax=Bacillus aquiflavi TaxID=2672567 RepID=A0A6B3VUQ5_9BACI|nr:cell wall-active antibiotics response protein [Bacillus aquiflavi]NEY80057.1 cell wall-active antibiotics response protein [Bacillus aquiflavi]UAC48988.1 cell wall-active antibiotics response protein [Bacillus aquiflavi]
MRYRSMNQAFYAICLLIIGILLLLFNLGVISLEIKELIVVIYPFLLFFIGLFRLFRFRSSSHFHLFNSLFLIIFGGLLIGDRFNLIEFRFWDFWKLWPIIFIYISMLMIFKKNSIQVHFGEDFHEKLKNADFNKTKRGFSIGDISFSKTNWPAEPMDLYNTIGDYFIDFSKAYIPEKEIPITIRGLISDVKILIPEDIPVNIKAFVKIGDVRIFNLDSNFIGPTLTYKSKDYDEAVKRLMITIELKIGAIRVDKV